MTRAGGQQVRDRYPSTSVQRQPHTLRLVAQMLAD